MPASVVQNQPPDFGRRKESGAKGVVVTHLKFCDPHAFDIPDLTKER